MAFALFAGYERSPEKWELGKSAYGVALKAVNGDRAMRQKSIAQFTREWKTACAE